jgi:hypothetical protein
MQYHRITCDNFPFFSKIVGNAISYIPFIIVSAGGAFFVYFLLPGKN